MPQSSDKPFTDFMWRIAERAKYLGDLKMPELRSTAGWGCDTDSEARELHKHEKRGALIEYILTEEFEVEAEDLDQTYEEVK